MPLASSQTQTHTYAHTHFRSLPANFLEGYSVSYQFLRSHRHASVSSWQCVGARVRVWVWVWVCARISLTHSYPRHKHTSGSEPSSECSMSWHFHSPRGSLLPLLLGCVAAWFPGRYSGGVFGSGLGSFSARPVVLACVTVIDWNAHKLKQTAFQAK